MIRPDPGTTIHGTTAGLPALEERWRQGRKALVQPSVAFGTN